MAGFATYDKGGGVPGTTMYADNFDFTGVTRTNTVTTNGQLPIGSTAANAGGNHINIGNITSPAGTLQIGYSSPNITIDLVGGLDDLHTAKWIVNQTPGAGGNSTTIQNAINNAVSGETIAIFPGTYTENLTLKAGVNLTAWGSDSSLNGTGHVIINGTCTLTTAGTVSMSGIQLQTNSAAILAVTGSAASVINLYNCYLNILNNTGITYSSSNAASSINIYNSSGTIGTTGISIFTMTATGTISFFNSAIGNNGSSTTASTISSGTFASYYSVFGNTFTTSGTSGTGIYHSLFNNAGINTVCLTVGGSGSNTLEFNNFFSGTASALSISATATVDQCQVSSSNTNAITGAGTINQSLISFTGSSSQINTSTIVNTPVSKINSPTGITFDNTNVLSTYKTATWTPNLQINGSSTGITYTTQLGGYTQIGNVVTIWAQILLSSKGVSTGSVTISNLPVASGASGASISIPVPSFNQITAVGYTSMGLQLQNTTSIGGFILSGTAVALSALTDTNLSNTARFFISGSYITN